MEKKWRTIAIPGAGENSSGSVYRYGSTFARRKGYPKKLSASIRKEAAFITGFQISDHYPLDQKSEDGNNYYVSDWQVMDRHAEK